MLRDLGAWLLEVGRWLLFCAAIAGAVFAYLGWRDTAYRQDIDRRGIATTATVENLFANKQNLLGNPIYMVELRWLDAEGKERKANRVEISYRYGIRVDGGGGRLDVYKTQIKYLASVSGPEDVIILDDIGQQDNNDLMMQVGAYSGIVGALGSGFLFWLARRRKCSS